MPIRLRNELKYAISVDEVSSLLSEISPFIQKDKYTNLQSQKYPVLSLYYDTPDFEFYREKVDGQFHRRKVRVRQYQNEFDIEAPFFLEIKERWGEAILKKRGSFDFETLSTIFKEDFDLQRLKKRKSSERTLIEEVKFLMYALKLTPAISIRYERYAFFDKYNKDFRFTIDTKLSYAYQPVFPSHQKKVHSFAPPLLSDIAIVEMKSSGEIPSWVQFAVQKFDLGLKSISKYCLCLGALKGI